MQAEPQARSQRVQGSQSRLWGVIRAAIRQYGAATPVSRSTAPPSALPSESYLSAQASSPLVSLKGETGRGKYFKLPSDSSLQPRSGNELPEDLSRDFCSKAKAWLQSAAGATRRLQVSALGCRAGVHSVLEILRHVLGVAALHSGE